MQEQAYEEQMQEAAMNVIQENEEEDSIQSREKIVESGDHGKSSKVSSASRRVKD